MVKWYKSRTNDPYSHIISGIIKKRRDAIDSLEEGFLKGSNAIGTRKNYDSHRKRYREFCDFSRMRPFPVSEFKICKFATFLTTKLKTVESIKAYCATIVQDNELKGFRPVRRGLKYYKCIAGIRQSLRHAVKRAEPMTEKLLSKIKNVVNFKDDREMATWVTMLGGFYMVLRKSNLVPLSRVHDMIHNITRNDVRYDKGVMVVFVRWSKTNQFQQEPGKILMVANTNNELCPVHWILYLTQRIGASPEQNLFGYENRKGLVPVTYRDLMVLMRKWIGMVGISDPTKYSSHSLRRGSSTLAHKKKISDTQIMRLGAWKSQCFRDYIQDDVGTRINTWYTLAGINK